MSLFIETCLTSLCYFGTVHSFTISINASSLYDNFLTIPVFVSQDTHFSNISIIMTATSYSKIGHIKASLL